MCEGVSEWGEMKTRVRSSMRKALQETCDSCGCRCSTWVKEGNRHDFQLEDNGKNGILLPKLFWHTVRKNCSSDWDNCLKILGLQPWIFKIFEPHESHISCKAFLMEDLTRIFISLHSFMPSHTNLQGIAPAPVRFNLFKQSEPFLITERFFNMFLEVSRSNKLEQLKLKLEKKILGLKNMKEKLEKIFCWIRRIKLSLQWKVYVWGASNSYVDAVACYEVLNCSIHSRVTSLEQLSIAEFRGE